MPKPNWNDMRNWSPWDWLVYAGITVVVLVWFAWYGLPFLGMG